MRLAFSISWIECWITVLWLMPGSEFATRTRNPKMTILSSSRLDPSGSVPLPVTADQAKGIKVKYRISPFGHMLLSSYLASRNFFFQCTSFDESGSVCPLHFLR
jgi:hypothetical protein